MCLFSIILLKLITGFSQSDSNALPYSCNIIEFLRKKSNGNGNVTLFTYYFFGNVIVTFNKACICSEILNCGDSDPEPILGPKEEFKF